MTKRKLQIISIVILSCLAMGIVDAVIQPGYVVKSFVKILLFLGLPILYSVANKDSAVLRALRPDKKGIAFAFLLGILVYAIVLGAYFLFKGVFDFSGLTSSLTSTTGVNKSNFVFVALYISFVNSLLEEFFFRGFAFTMLGKITSRKFAYLFSSLTFALYHIAMMIGWFGLPVVLISLAGLFVGGLIFDKFDERSQSIYPSWLVHMFANFATNTIGFVLFAA